MAFTDQTNRRLLSATALALVLLSLLFLWSAFNTPATPKFSSNGKLQAAPREHTIATSNRSLEDFQPLLRRSLGEPLYHRPEPVVDQTPTEPIAIPPQVVEPESVGLRLVGTMIEEGRSIAILVDPDGRIQLAKEGEKMDTAAGEAHINRIELNQVTLSLDDQSMTFRVE